MLDDGEAVERYGQAVGADGQADQPIQTFAIAHYGAGEAARVHCRHGVCCGLLVDDRPSIVADCRAARCGACEASAQERREGEFVASSIQSIGDVPGRQHPIVAVPVTLDMGSVRLRSSLQYKQE